MCDNVNDVTLSPMHGLQHDRGNTPNAHHFKIYLKG